MTSNRIFYLTFIVSIALHAAILTQTLNLNNPVPQKDFKDLQVEYLKELPKLKENIAALTKEKEELLRPALKISGHKRNPPPFINSENTLKMTKERMLNNPAFSKPTFTKPDINKPDIIAIKKKITLPPISLDIQQINNRYYMSYYQTVREKIRRAAYQNYIHTDTGEVYLSFVIASDGSLKDAKIQESKSQGSIYLEETALKSVSEASPFPPFPKELDYPQLSFNVIISFSIE